MKYPKKLFLLAVASLLTNTMLFASNEPTSLKIHYKDARQAAVSIPLSGLPAITFGSGVIYVQPSKGSSVSTYLCDDIEWLEAAQGDVKEYIPASESTGGRQSVNVSPDPKPERPVPEVPLITDLTMAKITLKDAEYFYTGKAIEAVITSVVCDGVTLQQGTHYSVSYSNNINAGQASLTITGIDDYSGSKTVQYTIMPETMTAAVITLDKDSYDFTGKAIEPTFSVKHGSTVLSPGTDYNAEITDNIQPGTATITVTGNGNYRGTVTKQFEIVQVKNVDFTVVIDNVKIADPTETDDILAYNADRGTVYLAGTKGDVGDTVTIIARPNTGYEMFVKNFLCILTDGKINHDIDTMKTTIIDDVFTTKFLMPTTGTVFMMFEFKEKLVSTIDGIETCDDAIYQVFDARGMLVATGRKQEGEEIEELLATLADGLYIIKVNNKTYKIYKR